LIADDQAEFFQSKVFPILESRCFECHGDGDVEAELHLTSRKAILLGGESGAAMVPGEPDRSLIVQAMRYESFQMPPRSKMPDEEIAIIAKWIQDGAAWPEGMESEIEIRKSEFPLAERMASHWAWKKIEPSRVPDVKDSAWPSSAVDQFLLAKMEAEGLSPAPDADRRAIIRRLYADLIGLPPSIEQQEHFFNDPAETPVAMERVVDQLLASSHFGERWSRHWLDLMRYAETLGHEFDYPLPHAWQYRDYVIRALNADVPYDQFVREHIAGDLLETPRRHPELGFNESIIATGFWYLCEDKHAPVDVRLEEALRVDNQIDVFGKTFLGLTISCARCHDHKFDAITAADYYALSGFLQSSRRRVEWLDQQDQNTALVRELIQARGETQRAQDALNKSVDSAAVSGELTAAIEAIRQGQAPATENAAETSPERTRLRALLSEPTTRSLAHPLSLPATIAQAPRETPVASVVSSWVEERNREVASRQIDPTAAATGWIPTQAGAPSVTAADLREGVPPNWRVFGAAFGGYTGSISDGGRFFQTSDSASGASWMFGRLEHSDSVSSANLSPQLRGQLHSPEFELTHPEIYVLAAGQNARVRLQIDGYVMNEFSELLFGGCRQTIDTNGQFQWIRIAGDVGRYLGHRCHLEFLDEDNGWFAVREVRLANHPGEIPPSVTEVCTPNRQLKLDSGASVGTIAGQIAEHFRSSGEPVPAEVAQLATNADVLAQLTAATDAWRKLTERPQVGSPVLVMCDGSGEDEYVFIRGNHNNRGPFVNRRLLTALDAGQQLATPVTSGRSELADRVLSVENPFPSRVLVNRVWQHLFGRGIVPTPDNFGVLGEVPSHPELLDHLAGEFRQDGWSVKRLIRRLVMTRAYRLSSERSEFVKQKDPTNRFFSHFSVRRMDAEVIRDNMLAMSGRLDATMYGPSIPVHLTSFMQGRGRPGESGPVDGAGRRSVYQQVRRNFLNPFMLAFDTPQPATTIGRRSNSNVPAQALMMLNNELTHSQANVWATRLIKDVPAGGPELLRHCWRQAFARQPSQEEISLLSDFAQVMAMERNVPGDQALLNVPIVAELCHVVMNQKEFVFLD
ncbi:MAG: PSD1 and planctomycete cytochrome C domain-containing protein, partial [Planctomycetota bacterium]